MVITEISDNKKNKYLKTVYVDYNYAFNIPNSYLKRFKKFEGDEITDDIINYYNNEVMLPKVKKKALSYLTKRPYGSAELKDKLLNYGYSEKNVDITINYLFDLNYLNDNVFVKMYVADGVNIHKKSIKRLKYELAKKKIPNYITEDVLSNYEEEENENLKLLIERKLSGINDLSPKSLDKLKMHFFRKGYNLNKIKSILNELLARDV